MKTIRHLLLLACCLSGLNIAAQDTSVVVRTALDPADEAWVGQRVRLSIDVLAPNGWASLPRMPTLEIAGAHVVQTESTGTRLNETINGEAHTGQRYEVSLFPRRPGPLHVPPVPLEISIRTFGAGTAPRQTRATAPALTLTILAPQGATTGADLVSTTDLKVSQTWDPSEADGVKVGDALKRTVTREAPNVSAMAFPPLPDITLDGVRCYTSQPRVTDTTDRGSLTGKRTETITYMFERPGVVRIPDVTIEWFNLRSKELRTETLPGREVTVAAGSLASKTVQTAVAQRSHRPALIFIVGLAAAAVVGAIAFRHATTHRLPTPPTERDRFQFFTKACTSGSAIEIYAALIQWLDRSAPPTVIPRLDQFVARHGSEPCQQLVRELESEALAPPTPTPWPQGKALRREIRAARQTAHTTQRRQVRADAALPSLNP